MPKEGDIVVVSGYYIADCPHHIDTKTLYYKGNRFRACPACPEPRDDEPKVEWTLVTTGKQDLGGD